MADQKRACSFCRKNQARLTVQGKYKGNQGYGPSNVFDPGPVRPSRS